MSQPPVTTKESSAAQTALLDLEKELTCSICTDVLYQPLTLLDCLHTFCGSCLKEWFGWQRKNADYEYERSLRSRSQRRRKPYTYTCPSCRSNVKDTRPNATVTSLLDMHLAANPTRKKTENDKEEIGRSYHPGEAVLLQPHIDNTPPQSDANGDNERDSRDEEDHQLLQHVQQMSLRDVEARRETRQERNASEQDSAMLSANDANYTAGRSRHHHSRSRSRATQLGHQSSLRSLISTDDSDEMREEIMRQIVEEGILDDIDWDNLQLEQEDELSERIAEAYRRRRRHRSRQRSRSRQSTSRNREQARPGSSQQRSQHSRAVSATAQSAEDSARPPVSRPHLFANNVDEPARHRHRRHRSASQERTVNGRPASSHQLTSQQQALHPAHDSNERSQRSAANDSSTRLSHESRRSTDPDGVSFSEQWRSGGAMPTSQPRARPERRRVSQPSSAPPTRTSFDTSPPPPHAETFPPLHQPSRPSVGAPESGMTVSCDRCGRHNIQNSLHYTCTSCGPSGSTFDLCLRCYRLGRGCNHWFGFGHAAWPRWERKASPGSEPPHILRSQKYISPLSLPESERPDNLEEPLLQLGVFCDVCHENANGCYWHCAECNDGEWGYCHRCVNQGRHCSHLLLPLTLNSPALTTMGAVTGPQTPAPPSPHSGHPTPATQMQTLLLPTDCNICGQSIPLHAQRLHCPDCSHGDYDVCMDCYIRLTAPNGVISPENGLSGLRKCANGANGHRMLLIDFVVAEEAPQYSWRRVLAGPVGGWAEELDAPVSTSSVARYGARGGKAQALWPWIPDDGVTDELSFPKGALVEELVSVNEEFSWGVFCRRGGYLPKPYMRML